MKEKNSTKGMPAVEGPMVPYNNPSPAGDGLPCCGPEQQVDPANGVPEFEYPMNRDK